MLPGRAGEPIRIRIRNRGEYKREIKMMLRPSMQRIMELGPRKKPRDKMEAKRS